MRSIRVSLRARDIRRPPLEADRVMQPARESFGARVAFRRALRVGAHTAPRHGLKLERDEAVDVIGIDLERAGDREPAADRAPRTLMRTATERMSPPWNSWIDRAVGIEV